LYLTLVEIGKQP